ncbi:DUF1016 N-terminal domain-containing protein [Sphingobacterium pedocola]|uniref:DUF1016 N-terminal domain-containing protein n=1 Tax=Sphingobacterium pedocola TaxID=2082722 RepID=UPI0021D24BED|nr:DUF1016 N-terminal domain-containing protein [Sphingobacterium pedocola]
MKYLSEQLQPEFGSGYSRRQIELFRQFYRVFPIANTLYSQLNWSQYKLLIRLDNQDKREFYIAETIKNNWTVRQLERQIYSSLYERLLLKSKPINSRIKTLVSCRCMSNKAHLSLQMCTSTKISVLDEYPNRVQRAHEIISLNNFNLQYHFCCNKYLLNLLQHHDFINAGNS